MSIMGDHDHEVCNTRLGLGITSDDFVAEKKDHHRKNKRVLCLDLSFPLHFKDENMDIGYKTEASSSKTGGEEDRHTSKNSTASNANANEDDDNNRGIVRKKLRLTKEQSKVLEDSFNHHTTLNTAQKLALAEKLKLKPRQVEVWFQNRRARTKLKQTEVDCEFLKKCCENLSDENRRLKKELRELQSVNMENSSTTTPSYVQLPMAAKLAMCPSCEKMSKSSAKGTATAAAAAAVDHVVQNLNTSTAAGLNFRT